MADQGWKICRAMNKRGWCLAHSRHKRVDGQWYHPVGSKPPTGMSDDRRKWRKK